MKEVFNIQEHHQKVDIEKCIIDQEHLHLVMIIPAKNAVSTIVGKIEANTSREISKTFRLRKEDILAK